MTWKDSSYVSKGLKTGGLIGGLIDIIGFVILVINIWGYMASQGDLGNTNRWGLMLFIIAIGVILGAFIIFIICLGIGALVGSIYEKIRSKK